MYYYGLVKFINAKKLQSNECINAFLQSEGISDFTAINHNKVNDYIGKNWVNFATFIDKELKSGVIQGKAIKLNTKFDEIEERQKLIDKEFLLFTKEEKQLINFIRKYDNLSHLSKTSSFFNNKFLQLPRNGIGISRAMKLLPKIQFILNSQYYNEYISFLKKKKIKLWQQKN